MRHHFLDQVVDGSDHFLVFSLLALPDELNDGLVKQVVSILS